MHLTNSELVAAILDELIPARTDRDVPAAGRPAVVSYVQEKLQLDPIVVELVEAGFDELAAKTKASFGKDFIALAPQQRVEALRGVEATQPFFIPLLLLQTYPAYYQQQDVLEGLGRPARPPFPKGYDVDVDDSALLKKIRARVGRPE